MPLPSPWARLPLVARWAISLLIAAAAVVALVIFISRHNGNGLAHVGTRASEREAREATAVLGADQAPVTVHLATGASATTALVAGVRHDMRHRIATGNVDGPLQRVGCGPAGTRGRRIAYHCIAEAGDVSYPFLAVVTPTAHEAVFCKRDFPPSPAEKIPVSARCRL